MSGETENGKINVWLDFDPGIDDAFALLLASYSKNLKIIGCSTLAGNQTIEKTSKNAIDLLFYYGLVKEKGDLPFPVIKGSSKPLIREQILCDEIHGESGLGSGTILDIPITPKNIIDCFEKLNSQLYHFSTLIFKFLKESEKKVTIIAIGPLTNIALLIINHPECVQYIEKIVMMGGGVGIGNITATSEFNVIFDSEAAHIVFESTIPIFMVPLNVTNNALVTKSIYKSIRSINSNFSKYLMEILEFVEATHRVYNNNLEIDCPLHDPCAVAFVVNPNLFEYKLIRVDVEKSSSLCYGQTVCDVDSKSDKRKNVHVCIKMDCEKFWDMMIEAIKKADFKSPLNI